MPLWMQRIMMCSQFSVILSPCAPLFHKGSSGCFASAGYKLSDRKPQCISHCVDISGALQNIKLFFLARHDMEFVKGFLSQPSEKKVKYGQTFFFHSGHGIKRQVPTAGHRVQLLI